MLAVNNKAGSFFAPNEFYYARRKIKRNEKVVDAFDSMHSLIQSLFETTACVIS
jgi:type I restriction enzyme R subunit